MNAGSSYWFQLAAGGGVNSWVFSNAAPAGVIGVGLAGQTIGAGPPFLRFALNATPVSTLPEPSTYALLASGLVGLALAARRGVRR